MPISGRARWAALMLALALLLPAVASAQNAYITNLNSNTVSVIDTATNKAGPPIPVGHGPFGVAGIPNSAKVYVTNFNDNTVSVIDLAPPDKAGGPQIPVGHGPFGVAVTPIPVGHGPLGVAVTPNGAQVYVANSNDATVSVIDTATNKVVGPPIPVGHAPYGVAVTPDGKLAYVTNEASATVSVIDTTPPNKVVATIPISGFPYGVAVTPDGKHAYVASFDGKVFVIDTATHKVGPPIPAGHGPFGVAVTPDGTKVYVGNVIDNTVSVIDTGLNKVNRPICMMAGAAPPCITATVSVGHGPAAFGNFIAWPWQPSHKQPAFNASSALATTRSQLAPSAAEVQPAQVQKVSNTTTGGSAVVAATLPVATTNGNAIVVTASGYPTPASISISDTLGNIYTRAGTIATSSSNEFVAIYYAKNIKAGTDTITLTGSASGQFSMTAAEFSGLDTTSPLDASATAQGSNAAPSSGLMTPSTSGDLVIGAGTHGFTTITTAGAGFTMLAIATEDDAAHQPLATEYQMLAGTNPIAANFSLAASGSWVVNASLFKPAVNTPTPPSIQSFIATPQNINTGNSSTLSWSVSGNPAPALSIDNGVGAVTGTSVSVTPATTTTYTLTATNSGGSSSASTTVTVNANDPAHIGQWSSPIATPIVLVHGLLLNNGKILAWSSGDQARIFDPATSSFTSVPDLITDLLCSGEVILSNGNPLSVGGENFGPPSKHADIFNLASSTWSAATPLNMARWYPTATVLPDGRVLATSGEGGSALGQGYVPVPEIYNPKTNAWTMMAASTSNPNTPNYPFMFVLPDGRVAFTGASEYDTITQILDINSQTWSTVDNAILPGSSAVMYKPGKVMKSGEAADSGFSGPATSTTYVIDFNKPTPAWRKTANMAYPRSFENLTALPDGTVLVTGGETTKDGANPANAVKAAELWNPITETWSTMASEQRPRLYHSIAILMPDGRVFVSGGGHDSPVPDELTAEYYSPPYLFKGSRPIISSAPGTVQYGSQFFVATPDASTIASVALIKASAVTHFTNMEQRFMNLSFTQASGGITVNAPASPNLATPGVYMLFIVNNNGVPSVAPFVTLPSSFDDTQPPSAPINLVANGSIGAASLSWSASTDNVGVTNYNLHRSAVSGFTPTIANRIAQPTTTAYTDSGLAAGTYYYVVTAQDAAGNVSGPSNEASAIVTSDTQPPTVSITTPLNGSTVSSTITVAATATDNVAVASVQFQLDSINLGAAVTTAPYQVNWDTTTATNGSHTLTAVARDTSGNVATSSAITVTVNNVAQPPSTLAIDKTVFKDQNTGSTITTASFSTASSNELLLAFISADGGSPNTTVTKVTTAGLVWTLVQRTNTQLGTAEVWRAFVTSALTNVTVAATLSHSVASSMTVVTFTGSDGAGAGGIGATRSASAASGAPTGTITTTRNNSWVFGVGTDWDNPIARTLGPTQTMVHQYLASVGDTYWVQRQNAPTPTSGTSVTINDTAPTGDRYNLSIVEVLPKP